MQSGPKKKGNQKLYGTYSIKLVNVFRGFGHFCALNNLDMHKQVFQQDGANSHTVMGMGAYFNIWFLFTWFLDAQVSHIPVVVWCVFVGDTDAIIWNMLYAVVEDM